MVRDPTVEIERVEVYDPADPTGLGGVSCGPDIGCYAALIHPKSNHCKSRKQEMVELGGISVETSRFRAQDLET